MTRAEWTDALCRRLSDAVAQEAPAGLGHWEPAWQREQTPSNALLDALAAFEKSGSEDAKRAAVQVASEVLAAWRAAAADWRQAGMPTPPAESELAVA